MRIYLGAKKMDRNERLFKCNKNSYFRNKRIILCLLVRGRGCPSEIAATEYAFNTYSVIIIILDDYFKFSEYNIMVNIIPKSIKLYRTPVFLNFRGRMSYKTCTVYTL